MENKNNQLENKIPKLLNQYLKPTQEHYKILGLSWAGWIL